MTGWGPECHCQPRSQSRAAKGKWCGEGGLLQEGDVRGQGVASKQRAQALGGRGLRGKSGQARDQGLVLYSLMLFVTAVWVDEFKTVFHYYMWKIAMDL